MHDHRLDQWQHSHDFRMDNPRGERRTRIVMGVTLVMMTVEIGAGYLFGSMALLADGWHMGTHAAALGITAFSYAYARRHAENPRFSFSTGKVGVLGGFTSAVVLGIVAILMAAESVERLAVPRSIRFDEAIGVAAVGLVVNIVCAFILQEGHHDHGEGQTGGADHAAWHDHNLRAAYFHVLADAFTSVLAIGALLLGKSLGWVRMDPAMGVVGAVIIARWAYGLMRDTSGILLDSGIPYRTVEKIRKAIEAQPDTEVVDIHAWRVSPRHIAVMISVVTHFPKPPDAYKALLQEFPEIVHVTVEVHQCTNEYCLLAPAKDTPR